MRILSDEEGNEADEENKVKMATIELLRDRKDRLQGMVRMAELLASTIEQEIKELDS